MSTPESLHYRIEVQGQLDQSWSDCLSGMTIEVVEIGPPVVTRISGDLVDQSALHGVLNTLHELRLPIISTTAGPARNDESAVLSETAADR